MSGLVLLPISSLLAEKSAAAATADILRFYISQATTRLTQC